MDRQELPVLSPLPSVKIAIIGGTHLNDAIFQAAEFFGQAVVTTPEGDAPPFYFGQHAGVPFVYVHFHGENRWLPTWLGLQALGVREVLTGATAGGVHAAFRVFDLVVPDDFTDHNVDRPVGIPLEYLGGADYAFPRFCPPMDEPLRQILIDECRRVVRSRRDLDDLSIHPVGQVCQARGGRFETPAEIRALRLQGADLVTLNVGTEITYARQLGMHLACLNLISNPAEGTGHWDWDLIPTVYQRMNPVCTEIILNCLPRIAALPEGLPRTGDTLRKHPPLRYTA